MPQAAVKDNFYCRVPNPCSVSGERGHAGGGDPAQVIRSLVNATAIRRHEASVRRNQFTRGADVTL